MGATLRRAKVEATKIYEKEGVSLEGHVPEMLMSALNAKRERTPLALVARSVPWKEMRATPKAEEAVESEWADLRKKQTWDDNHPREDADIIKDAEERDVIVHFAALMELCVEKRSELPKDDPARKFKGRVVVRGDMMRFRLRVRSRQVA